MIICIVGPTGVGKTKMSVELAKKYNAIIINCDATQVYKELDIGSAKATTEEKQDIPHYLLDFKNIDENYTVYDYQKDARKIIEENKDKNIIFVGGTALYLKAALYDYRFPEESELPKSYEEYTNEEIYELALKKDPNVAIHPNNRKRLIRFLNKESVAIVEPKPLYKHLIIGLTTNREHLYNIINSRVDKMMESGLEEEVRAFYDKNIKLKPVLTAIGYKELYHYFDGTITKEEAVDTIKKNSRHYAKRQYTFLNNQLDVNWFEVDYNDFDKTINEVEEFIKENYDAKS